MTLDAPTYFGHLRAYVNSEYVVDDGAEGKIVLAEKYFRADDFKPQTRRIELVLPGSGMAFKLDHDEFEFEKKKVKNKKKEKAKKNKPALFHFLDDNAKPWSKRCDFVIFYINGQSFHADCIEFKSKNLDANKIVPQLKAGACWVSTLKRVIENYTGDRRRIRLRKFVFAENESPDAYLDANRQLNADPSIRYYHFDEVNGQSLAGLTNTSVQDI